MNRIRWILWAIEWCGNKCVMDRWTDGQMAQHMTIPYGPNRPRVKTMIYRNFQTYPTLSKKRNNYECYIFSLLQIIGLQQMQFQLFLTANNASILIWSSLQQLKTMHIHFISQISICLKWTDEMLPLPDVRWSIVPPAIKPDNITVQAQEPVITATSPSLSSHKAFTEMLTKGNHSSSPFLESFIDAIYSWWCHL